MHFNCRPPSPPRAVARQFHLHFSCRPPSPPRTVARQFHFHFSCWPPSQPRAGARQLHFHFHFHCSASAHPDAAQLPLSLLLQCSRFCVTPRQVLRHSSPGVASLLARCCVTPCQVLRHSSPGVASLLARFQYLLRSVAVQRLPLPPVCSCPRLVPFLPLAPLAPLLLLLLQPCCRPPSPPRTIHFAPPNVVGLQAHRVQFTLHANCLSPLTICHSAPTLSVLSTSALFAHNSYLSHRFTAATCGPSPNMRTPPFACSRLPGRLRAPLSFRLLLLVTSICVQPLARPLASSSLFPPPPPRHIHLRAAACPAACVLSLSSCPTITLSSSPVLTRRFTRWSPLRKFPAEIHTARDGKCKSATTPHFFNLPRSSTSHSPRSPP